jgi:hypothetical protein
MARKIPESLNDEIIKKAGEGLSANKICVWLKDEHKLIVSIPTLSRLLKETKEERKEIAQRAYADAVADSANQDIKILGSMIDKFYKKVEKLFKDDQLVLATKMSETLLKYLSRRMDLSGINAKDKPNDELLTEELLKKIEEFKK